MEEKRCCHCKLLKPFSAFYKSLTEKDGLKRDCKDCLREYDRAWRKRNREYVNARSAAYQKTHPEKAKAWNKIAQERGRDKFNKQKMERYEANKVEIRAASNEKYRSDSEYRDDMLRRAGERYAKKCAEDPMAWFEHQKSLRKGRRVQLNRASSNRRALVSGAEGMTTPKEWLEILSYFNYCCAYCLCHESEVGTLGADHMRPLVRGGSNTADNIVPACRRCNSSKNDRTPLEYIARQNGVTLFSRIMSI